MNDELCSNCKEYNDAFCPLIQYPRKYLELNVIERLRALTMDFFFHDHRRITYIVSGDNQEYVKSNQEYVKSGPSSRDDELFYEIVFHCDTNTNLLSNYTLSKRAPIRQIKVIR